MEAAVRTHFELPVGYHAFHPKQLFRFSFRFLNLT